MITADSLLLHFRFRAFFFLVTVDLWSQPYLTFKTVKKINLQCNVIPISHIRIPPSYCRNMLFFSKFNKFSSWSVYRNLNADYWGTFFDTLLNIESCDAMPDLETLRADTQACMSNSNQLGLSVSALGRIMLER